MGIAGAYEYIFDGLPSVFHKRAHLSRARVTGYLREVAARPGNPAGRPKPGDPDDPSDRGQALPDHLAGRTGITPGSALLGQGQRLLKTDRAVAVTQLEAAAPLLLESVAALEKSLESPPPAGQRVTAAIRRLVALYQSWEKPEAVQAVVIGSAALIIGFPIKIFETVSQATRSFNELMSLNLLWLLLVVCGAFLVGRRTPSPGKRMLLAADLDRKTLVDRNPFAGCQIQSLHVQPGFECPYITTGAGHLSQYISQ